MRLEALLELQNPRIDKESVMFGFTGSFMMILSFMRTFSYFIIGIGASSAGAVLAGPLFRRFNEIHYRYLHVRCYRQRSISVRLLQPDHFKSPSHTPVYRPSLGLPSHLSSLLPFLNNKTASLTTPQVVTGVQVITTPNRV